MGKGRNPKNRRNNLYHQVQLGQVSSNRETPIPELWKVSSSVSCAACGRRALRM